MLTATRWDWFLAAIVGLYRWTEGMAPILGAGFILAALAYLAVRAILDGAVSLVREARDYRPEPRNAADLPAPLAAIAPPTEPFMWVGPKHSAEFAAERTTAMHSVRAA